MTELEFPFVDPFRALKYINEIYKISPDNLDALILEAGIKKCYTCIDHELFKRLDNVKNNDNKTNSIIIYLKSYYAALALIRFNYTLSTFSSYKMYTNFV